MHGQDDPGPRDAGTTGRLSLRFLETEALRPDLQEVRLLAAALYDPRLLLTSRVGKADNSPETEAAAIAYALHNDALAAPAGRSFDLEPAGDRG